MFGGLFGKKKTDSEATKVPKLSPAISSSIFSAVGSRSIPSMPGPAHKAFQLATDPNAEARDFIEIIEADEALSAKVLKIANSVYYDRGKRSSTIEESVLVIGIEELRGLLNANTLSDIFPCRHVARTQLWGNDIATAIVSRSLAQRILPSKTAIAFLGGLMHDVGKLLLLQRVTDDYAKVLQLVESEGLEFCLAEERLFPFDHTQVGQLVAEKWNFTSELIDIIASHHRPFSDRALQGSQASLPEIIHAADIIAHSLGLGHPKGLSKFRSHAEEDLEKVWKIFRIAESEQKTLLAGFKRTFEVEYDLYAGKI